MEVCEGEGGESRSAPLLDKGGALSEGAMRLGHEASVKDLPRASQMGSVQRLQFIKEEIEFWTTPKLLTATLTTGLKFDAVI